MDTPLSDARPELLFNQLTGGSNAVRSLYAPGAMPTVVARPPTIGGTVARRIAK